jgi:DNA-binding CsgD family transcriptional regulator
MTIAAVRRARPGHNIPPRITGRQLQCLALAADGLTMDSIAARVYLSTWSVKNDLVQARDVLRARNTTHAVAIAMRNGLLADAGRPIARRHPGTRPTGTGWPT